MTLDSEIQMTGAMACAGQGFDVATDLFGCLDPKKTEGYLGGCRFSRLEGVVFLGGKLGWWFKKNEYFLFITPHPWVNDRAFDLRILFEFGVVVNHYTLNSWIHQVPYFAWTPWICLSLVWPSSLSWHDREPSCEDGCCKRGSSSVA